MSRPQPAMQTSQDLEESEAISGADEAMEEVEPEEGYGM